MSRKKRGSGAIPELKNDDFSFAGLAEAGSGDSFAEMLDYDIFDQVSKKIVRGNDEKIGPAGKGYPAVQEELDLHGCTSAEAKVKVENFLLTARMKGLRTLRIITGKGLHSQGAPVLPDFVELMARQCRQEGEIADFRWENGSRGASGAIIVYL